MLVFAVVSLYNIVQDPLLQSQAKSFLIATAALEVQMFVRLSVCLSQSVSEIWTRWTT